MRQAERKLIKAGIDTTGITFTSARELEVKVLDADGNVDKEATEARYDEVMSVLGWDGGYLCGHGARVGQKNRR